jgi:alanine or glycine:cation symporter, AGCS family
MEQVVNWLNGIIWSQALIYLCLGVGLFYTLATRFVQVRHMKDIIPLMFKGEKSDAGIS